MIKCRVHRALLLVMLLGTTAESQTAGDAFARGNEYYRAARFAEAVKEYENVTKQGYVSAPLYFNLGNAYYRMGNMARTILSYERASRLDPGDPDLAFNLRLANLRIVDRIEPVPELFLITWLKTLSSLFSMSTTIIVLVVTWIFLFGLLIALNLLPQVIWVGLLRRGILVSLVLVVLFGLLLGLQLSQASDRAEAIVTEQVVTAKNSPDPQSVDAFVIHEGLKVRLSDTVGKWVKITLADGKVGWIPDQDCERI